MSHVKARARAHVKSKTKARSREEDRAGGQRAEAAPGVARAMALQQQAGNQAVARLIAKEHGKEGGHKPPVEDREEDVKQLPKLEGGGAVTTLAVQRDDDPPVNAPPPQVQPAKVEYKAGAVTPTFPLDKPASKRSNSDSSTTQPATPTFTGHAAYESGSKKWRYQLTGIESKGKIQIVYYTDDHYPAPTPEDDTGALSNVTKTNWSVIVKDLKDHRTGIAAKWSAYAAEDLHENYHWVNEWQATVKPKFTEAQTEIAALEDTTAVDQAAADTTLEPKARKIFTDKIKQARATFDALGDSPGDPPYIAQAPAIDALVKRVEDHAAAQKW
jgi:hypothetical protein